MKLADVITALRKKYGAPAPPTVTDPWEMILFENCAYMVDDDRRAQTWSALKRQVGSKNRAPTPEQILMRDEGQLAMVIQGGGMQPMMRAGKLREAARVSFEEYGGDLKPLVSGPVEKARRGLKDFPGIGEPGADKILLFARIAPSLALESNGLRALIRLGFGKEDKNYAVMYKSVTTAIAKQIKPDFDWLIAAHQLLHRHGQELCLRTAPKCDECPLRKTCPSAGKVV